MQLKQNKYLASFAASLPITASFISSACNGQCPACGGCLTLVAGAAIAGTACLTKKLTNTAEPYTKLSETEDTI